MPLLVFSALRAIWALRRDPQFASLALLAAVAIVSGCEPGSGDAEAVSGSSRRTSS